MRAKLLLHAVEGMTSLSKLFKSLDDGTNKTITKQIQIRPLHTRVEQDESSNVAQQTIERERQLQEAQTVIEQEKQEINQMRTQVITEIDEMRAAWENERQQLEQQAYEEGFQSGYQEGHSKALSDMSEAIQQANDITIQSKKLAEDYREQQERVILEIAMRVAERIMHTTLEENEECYLSIVKRALTEVREMKEIRLYVSTDDYELVTANKSELDVIFPPDVPFFIFPNEELERNACYIETNHGRMVVTVDEQLTQLKEGLIEVLEGDDTD